MAKILIIDDELVFARSVAQFLNRSGHECSNLSSAEESLSWIEAERPDLILLDIKLAGMGGLEALKRIAGLDPNAIVIMMTAFSSVESAVAAMKEGAYDYLQKPIDHDELKLTIEKALETRRLRDRLSYFERKEARETAHSQILGGSPGMKQIRELIERIVRLESQSAGDLPTVLLLGETGTGKDLVARAIHHGGSLAGEPFVEVDCTSIPKDLAEAELFGHEKGAFTGATAAKPGLIEAAHGGTLFLDEIGELGLDLQAKLLRAIERKQVRRLGSIRDRTIHIRIISATNRDLEHAIRRGLFRQDLYYRLKVLSIELPPLRERGDDVVILANYFLERLTHRYSLPGKRLTASSLDAIRGYHWPGNVRELAHVIERALLVCDGVEIAPADLGIPRSDVPFQIGDGGLLEGEFPEEGVELRRIERQLIEKALALTGGNVAEAARKLGIGREALRYRIQKHRLSPQS
ncbi:MAG: sigma-54-dependent transcriptional regulator [Candidatus Methylomirabilaceae bacterium]